MYRVKLLQTNRYTYSIRLQTIFDYVTVKAVVHRVSEIFVSFGCR